MHLSALSGFRDVRRNSSIASRNPIGIAADFTQNSRESAGEAWHRVLAKARDATQGKKVYMTNEGFTGSWK